MRKMIMIALVLMASASLFTVSAADKGKKDKSKKMAVVPVALSTTADSLSYAAGINATRGLIPFIQQNNQVDTAYMSDFIRGYKEAISKGDSPQNTAYIAGLQIAEMVSRRILPGTREELKSTKDSISAHLFHEGFIASLAKDTTFFNAKKAEDFQKDALAGAGVKFLAENAKIPGVKILPSGLQYKVITEGHGEVPKASDEVEVIYEGRLIDGTVFDATSRHPGGAKSDKFKAGNLIKGWTEALTMMPVGSKWQLYIPQELAYGARQAGQIPPYSTLVFDLELVSIVKPEAPKETESADNGGVETVKPKTATKVSSKRKSVAKKVRK